MDTLLLDRTDTDIATINLAPLATLADTVKALIANGDQATEKAEQFYQAAGLHLKNAKANKPPGITWPVYVRDTFDLSQQRADELIRLADGKTTLKKVRGDNAEQKRNNRKTTTKTKSEPTGHPVGSEPEPPPDDFGEPKAKSAHLDYAIIIDAEFHGLLPPLRPEEFKQLEKSILREGCNYGLVVWAGHNILLDGHARYEICMRHNIPFRVHFIDLPDRDHAAIWILENQLGRCNLSEDQIAIISARLESAEFDAWRSPAEIG